MATYFSTVAIMGCGLSAHSPFLIPGPKSPNTNCPRDQSPNLGLKATIYESRPKHYAQPGTIVLTPNALRILSSIKEGAFSYTQFSIVKKYGEGIWRMAMGSEERYGYPALIVIEIDYRVLCLMLRRKVV